MGSSFVKGEQSLSERADDPWLFERRGLVDDAVSDRFAAADVLLGPNRDERRLDQVEHL